MTDPEPARRLPPTVLATCVLPWDDRLRLDEGAFREHVRLVAARMTPMLGVISNSLGTVIERLEFGLGLGYRQFQISFPAWGRVGDAEGDVFFRETCGRFGQAQFLHYNTPRGGRVLTGAEYGRLAAEHASLAAVKFTSSDPAVVAELVRERGPGAVLPDRARLRARGRELRAAGLAVRRAARPAGPVPAGPGRRTARTRTARRGRGRVA